MTDHPERTRTAHRARTRLDLWSGSALVGTLAAGMLSSAIIFSAVTATGLAPLCAACALLTAFLASVLARRRALTQRATVEHWWGLAHVDPLLSSQATELAGRPVTVRVDRHPLDVNAATLPADDTGGRILLSGPLADLGSTALDGLLAHEAAHVAADDPALLPWAEGALLALASPRSAAVLLLLSGLSGTWPLLASLVIVGVQWRHWREYRADLSGVMATHGDVDAVAAALLLVAREHASPGHPSRESRLARMSQIAG